MFLSVFQISEELEKVKQEMEEKGSSMSDGGETDDLILSLFSVFEDMNCVFLVFFKVRLSHYYSVWGFLNKLFVPQRRW